jgi:hypothetical protein
VTHAKPIPPQAATLTLRSTIDIAGFGGSELRVLRLDRDSQPFLLVRQSTGQTRNALVRHQAVNPPGSEHLHCITALDLAGRVLWQHGRPHRHEDPYNHHGALDLHVADIDADGRPEVVAVEVDRLLVLDAADGRIKASTTLPADNFNVVTSGRLLPGDPRRQLVVKNGERGYPGFDYGDPTLIFDADLRLVQRFDHIHGAGHVPVCVDLDGDGCEELLVGYSMVRRAREVAWTLPVPNASIDHADDILPFTLDGGEVRIAYSGSKDFFVVDAAGVVQWSRQHEHSQDAILARLRHDERRRPEPCIILNEKWIGMTAYTLAGQELWRRPGVGYARLALSGWRDDGLDLIAYQPALTQKGRTTPYPSEPEWSRQCWPIILDPQGQPTDLLTWRDEYQQPVVTLRSPLPYDYGVGYRIAAMSLEPEAPPDLMVHDRRRIMIFSPQPSRA